MALSNIFREPRREIVESAVGFVVLGLLLWLDYKFARWFEYVTTTPTDYGFPWPAGMLAGVIIGFVIYFALLIAHEIGDLVCEKLDDVGIHLRPKRRY